MGPTTTRPARHRRLTVLGTGAATGALLVGLSLLWLISERLLVTLLGAGTVLAVLLAPPRLPRTRGAWQRAAVATLCGLGGVVVLALVWPWILFAVVVALHTVDYSLLNP